MNYVEKRKQIDLLQQKINAYGELRVEVKKKINYKFRLDWNYYSNSMEGNTLTLDETRSVMVGNLTVGGKPIKDVLEIKGHDEVIADILKIGKGASRLSEKRIKEIHKGIKYEDDKEKVKKIGIWKTDPNYIINYKGEKFEFVAPADVPERMHHLLNTTNAAIDAIQQNKKNAQHPLDIALQFHLDYVLIHPFYDGNGRTARILTNLLLISLGYPPFWIKTNERNAFNQYIADIQGYGGMPDLFFELAADMILRSLNLVLDAIEGKSIEEEEDIDKEIELFKKSLSRHNESTKLKSVETVQSILMDSGITLFQKLIHKLSKLNELFHETEIRFIFSEREDILYDVKTRNGGLILAITDQFPNSFLNWLEKKEPTELYQFGIEFFWQGYKLTTPAFNVGVYANFKFANYSYHIERSTTFDGQDHYLKNSYDVPLSVKDINFTVNTIVKDILKEIKQNHFEA